MTKKEKLVFIISAVVIFLGICGVIIFKHFFEFNNKEVDDQLMQKASGYSDKDSAFKILRNSTHSILGNFWFTRQVNIMAKATGLPKETVLADAALNLAQSQKFLA